ncbi:uncharacterized protein LOC127748662 [Frankliniella occidentalis]|uniref:Uncharacterized protein LOC127748662 n=1 Tax=Frankliniella occidentalis TaxID=133901 RepID=A0A9C6XA30_FRAOC|nr:uncharacterized protein LOC127748662 [Frankliniella occidentalis]
MNHQQQPFEFVRKVTSTTSTTTEELFVALYNPNIPPPIGPTTVPLFPPPPQPQPPQPLALLNPPPTPPQPQFNQHVTVPHPPQPPQPQMNHHQHAAFSYPPHPPQPYHRAALPRHHQPPPCHHQATLEHAGPIDMTVGKSPKSTYICCNSRQ